MRPSTFRLARRPLTTITAIASRMLLSQCQSRRSSHSPMGAPSANPRKKVTINTLRTLHQKNEPITMITAHDFPSAHVADAAGMDMILVGDSLAMVALGMEDTSELVLEDMILHCRSVSRATKAAFTVSPKPPCYQRKRMANSHPIDWRPAHGLVRDSPRTRPRDRHPCHQGRAGTRHQARGWCRLCSHNCTHNQSRHSGRRPCRTHSPTAERARWFPGAREDHSWSAAGTSRRPRRAGSRMLCRRCRSRPSRSCQSRDEEAQDTDYWDWCWERLLRTSAGSSGHVWQLPARSVPPQVCQEVRGCMG